MYFMEGDLLIGERGEHKHYPFPAAALGWRGQGEEVEDDERSWGNEEIST